MMRFQQLLLSCAFAIGATVTAQAQDTKFSDGVIRIGVLNDRSGPYADLSGEGSAIGARMAAEEFGNKVLGVPVEIVVADHQNKTDVGAGIARKWYDADGVDVIADISNSAMSLALNGLVKERKKLVFHNSGSADISGKGCAPRAIQWMYSVYATAANVATKENIDGGMNTFYIISVDYALGASISKVFKAAMANTGAKILGEVSHPLNSTDFSSYLLQAQSSGAKAVLLATGGQDLGNAVKQAAEFGLTPKVQLLAAAMTTAEIEANGLAVMQGLQTVSFYEWNRDDKAKAWGQKFAGRAGGKIPAGSQAATYSQVRHYLKAVEAAGTDDADAVIAKMKEMTVDDAFTSNGHIREDGLLLHDMYLVRLKAPSESTGKGDYTKIVQVIPGERANIPLAQSECPTVKK